MSSNLLHEMLAYCERTGTPISLVGRKTTGDSSLINDMRRGRSITARTADRIRAILAKHPEGFHSRGKIARQNPNPADNDQRTYWETAAEYRAASQRLLEATPLAMRPASITARAPLSFEEKLALVQSGRAKLVQSPVLSREYAFSLTGGSL